MKLFQLVLMLISLSCTAFCQNHAGIQPDERSTTNLPTVKKPPKPVDMDDHAALMDPTLSAAGRQAVADAMAQADVIGEASRGNSRLEAQYNEAFANYRNWILRDLELTYRWQNISSIVIFIVVMLLVITGVYFSWLQFKAAGFKSDITTMDSSVQGIKITTSAIGLIILVASMGFLFLYLKFVYPINITNADQAVQDATAAQNH